jgi:hypothetical protein
VSNLLRVWIKNDKPAKKSTVARREISASISDFVSLRSNKQSIKQASKQTNKEKEKKRSPKMSLKYFETGTLLDTKLVDNCLPQKCDQLQVIPSSVFIHNKSHNHSFLLRNICVIISPEIPTNQNQFISLVGIGFRADWISKSGEIPPLF